MSSLFDSYYYEHGCGEPYQRSEAWLAMFDYVSNQILREMNPGSVLDAGCALGLLVESLRSKGVDAYGMDISEYAIENVHPSVKPFCWVGSITNPLPRRFDLIITIEVLEHLPPDQCETAIINLCQASDDILFSSTPFDYKESTHFNVQMPEYWAEAFARQGFYRDVDFDASFLTPWAVRFRRRQEPIHRLVYDYERKFWPLAKENTDLRSLALSNEQQIRAKEEQIAAQNQQIQAQQEQIQSQQEQIQAQAQQLQDLDQRIAGLDQELQDQRLIYQRAEQEWNQSWSDLQNSTSWRMIKAVQKMRLSVIPENSQRERFLKSVVKGKRK
jgi:SAM-dependent methyltransferase